MGNDSRSSVALSVLKRAHGRAVFGRRVRVLSQLLAAEIPANASVLDIGCGDGTLASQILLQNPGVTVSGLEFAPRPQCSIPCVAFDGKQIPHASGSFDVCMFVDVLHHTGDQQALMQLVSEATRVSRRYVLIKDHVAGNGFDFKILSFMDWVGNRPHGVVLPYNYQNREQWNDYFMRAGLNLDRWNDAIPLYPFPASMVFGRKLHFIARLEKDGSALHV